MAVVRSFIAIELPQSLQQQLEHVAASMQELLRDLPIRWVPVPNIHLTLKFLGDVSTSNISMVTNILQVEAASVSPFEVSIGEFGVFPKINRPRVLWVGVQASDELLILQRRIESETTRLGYPPDKRSFNPHLTLGRVSRNADPGQVRQIGNLLRDYKLGFLGAARISQVHLFRSDLKPDGAVYTKLFSQDLDS